MTKIVYNACYGGFSLSHEAMLRYAEIKGIKLYPKQDKKDREFWTYWTVPADDVIDLVHGGEAWKNASIEERMIANQKYDEHTIGDRELDRADPALAQVVEEMGARASGVFAKLKVVEIPAGEKYRISEYDGYESVMRPDDYDWKIA